VRRGADHARVVVDDLERHTLRQALANFGDAFDTASTTATVFLPDCFDLQHDGVLAIERAALACFPVARRG
jgi:hypothetical protein